MVNERGLSMMVFSNRKIFWNVFVLLTIQFFHSGVIPAFSQEIFATVGFGGEFLAHDKFPGLYVEVPGGHFTEGEDTLNNGMTMGVNLMFIGNIGITVSAGTDIKFWPYQGLNIDPVFGLGYVHYRTYYAGGILNVTAKPYLMYVPYNTNYWDTGDIFIVPTLVGGYNFRYFILSGQLSYMRGVLSRVNGIRFSLGIGINLLKS